MVGDSVLLGGRPPEAWPRSVVSLGHRNRRHVGRVWTKCAVSKLHWEHSLERARCKVKRFEEALKAMGDMQGPEVEFLRDELKRVRQAAQDRPLASQLCTSIIECSEICRTRSKDGSAQRGTQSSDPSRSPSRGVVARRAATHPCSGCLRRIGRIGRIEGEVGHGMGTIRCIVTSLQAASDVPPPIPDSFVLADLSSWMDDRHAELFAGG